MKGKKWQPVNVQATDQRKSLDDQTAVKKALQWPELQRAHRDEIQPLFFGFSQLGEDGEIFQSGNIAADGAA